ncbi:restriction endonuclease [Adhaeribacter swui]|uniref:Restriction endonuclease n=1 Tax=Adhaeribacter swui TaxID=2086471 RepID=A0A7G7G6B0_9BACT|nr:restriction endonuclease [Adhaeribacter swui]QNF32694.1 restriction endonuclease [Adhaeribacter swui]
MKAWSYKQHINPKIINDFPFNSNCRYCGNKMEIQEIKSYWDITAAEFIKTFEELKFYMRKETGVGDETLNLRPDTLDDESTSLLHCNICSWWRIQKHLSMWAPSQLWDSYFGVSGVLKNLDFTDQSIPIKEIRNYLAARYNHRFHIHPKVFEEVVSSVFKSLGYNNYITAYSNDGGIDVVLERPDKELIGIQIKRYKKSIKVEQIRSFLGALMINNMTKGLFVCTSDFQSGCFPISKSFPIMLINAQSFYEALKEAQQKDNDNAFEFNKSSIPRLYYFDSLHRNSL